MADKLTLPQIANFCLLVNKYSEYLEENNIPEDIFSKNDYFLESCSESVSQMLKVMDECQKGLYKFGYDKDNVENMTALKEMFKKGLDVMQEVLGGFEIATAVPGNDEALFLACSDIVSSSIETLNNGGNTNE